MSQLYLGWARETAAWLGHYPRAYDLFSSAIYTSHELMAQQIQAHGALDLLTGGSKLSASWGHPALREAIRTEYAVPADVDVLLTAGASSAFALVGRAWVDGDSDVIIESPVYEPFVTVVQDQRPASMRFLERRVADNYAVDVDALRGMMQANTRLIVLTNLHNPSGALLTESDLQAIAAVAREFGAYVVVDEIYRDLVDNPPPIAANIAPDVFITISSLTKAYGLGSVRAGWIIAHNDIMPRLRDVHITYENSLTPYTQALTALVFAEHAEAYRQHARDTVMRNRAIAAEAFATMHEHGLLDGGFPPYGVVAFPRVVDVDDTAHLATWLRETYHMVVAPGHFFRAPQHIRLCLGGHTDRLQEALTVLTQALMGYQLER